MLKPATFLSTFLFVASVTFSQTAEYFMVDIEPLVISNAPGVHSFSWGLTSDNRWVILGGRIDGLHRRQPWASFLEQDNNKEVFVIDLVSEQVWSADLSTLPANLFEQLQSTNQQFSQRENMLYITGGYGFSPTLNEHLTYPGLIAIDLDLLANSVVSNTSLTPAFRQITDPIFKITGGQMEYLDSTFYLVGGHLFDGQYNPMGPNNGPGFTQIYSNEIRTFKLSDDGINLSFYDYQAVHDTVNLHRRDYNLSPQIFPNGQRGFTAFSGVFDYNDMPYLNSVDIEGPSSYSTNNSFNQYLSQYHSAKMPVYDTAANVMHTFFFGGLSQFTLNASGILVEDVNVPFVKTISRISRDASGSMIETDLGYIEMPSLVGPGAEFIPLEQFYYDGGILNINSVPNVKTLVGYIYGGIESSEPNIFFINDGTQSFASNVIFKVFVQKSNVGLEDEIPLKAENVLSLNIYPNPVRKNLNLSFMGLAYQEVYISVYDTGGRLILRNVHDVNEIGLQEVKVNVSELDAGNYVLTISNGVIYDERKFIKQ